jgi:hypothetical protein
MAVDSGPPMAGRYAPLHGTVRIEASPERVFDVLADPREYRRLVDPTRPAEFSGPIQVGMYWTSSTLGLYRWRNQIVVYDRPRRVVRRITGAWEQEVHIAVRPEASGSVVEFSLITSKRPFFISSRSERERMLNNLKTLASHLEGNPPPRPTQTSSPQKTLLLWILLIASSVTIWQFMNNQYGAKIAMDAVMATARERPDDLAAKPGEPQLLITVTNGEPLVRGEFRSTKKAFYAEGPVDLRTLAQLKTWGVRYKVSRVHTASWGKLLVLAPFYLGLMALLIGFVALAYHLISSWLFEPPLLPRHHSLSVVAAFTLALALMGGLCRFAGSLGTIAGGFSPRPNAPVIRDSVLAFSSPLRYLFTAPTRGDVVQVVSERAAGMELRHPDSLRLVGNEGAASRLFHHLHMTSVIRQGRIVAMPGEQVAVVNGNIAINGTPLEEPYVLKLSAHGPSLTVALADQEYLLAEDVRDGTDIEEKTFVVVHARQIVDRVSFVLLPLRSFGPVRSAAISADGRTSSGRVRRLNRWLLEM